MATPEELANIEPEKKVDARGTACPGPLLEAKRSITSVSMGGVMEVLSSDASTNKEDGKNTGGGKDRIRNKELDLLEGDHFKCEESKSEGDEIQANGDERELA